MANILPTSAWKEHLAAINDFFLQTKNRPMSALYLNGPPHSGLRTTFLEHLLVQADVGAAPRDVIYVTSTRDEKQYLEAYAHDTWGERHDLPVVTRKEHCCPPEMLRGGDITMIVDVNMAATVDDEIFFGILLRDCKAAMPLGPNARVAIVLLGNSYFSNRTFRAFKRIMPIEAYTVADLHPPLRFHVLGGRTWAKKAEGHLLSALKDGKRVVMHAEADVVHHMHELWAHLEGEVEDIHSAEEYRKGLPRAANLQGTSPTFSHPTNLGAFLSTGTSHGVQLDMISGQLVHASRQLTRSELEEQMAWVLKAEGGPGQVRFMTTYTREDYLQRPLGDETVGPAWNEDLLYNVLAMFVRFPGVTIPSLPVRQPPNHYAAADAVARLVTLQCIREVLPWGRGQYEVLELGSAVFQLCKQGIPWEAAVILAKCGGPERPGADHSLTVASRTVLIHMAAIAVHVPRTLIARSTGRPIPPGGLGNASSPVVRPAAENAGLWFAAGAYFANRNMEEILNATADRQEVDVSPADWFFVMPGPCKSMGEQALLWMELCGLSWRDRAGADGPLPADQIRRIHITLMWAFLHRTLFLYQDENKNFVAKALISNHPVQINREEEFLAVAPAIAQAQRETMGPGFFAIHNDMIRVIDGDAVTYIASDLTKIPFDIFPVAVEATGIEWPLLIRSGIPD
ncbi:hypothetical protein F4780DRAFT_794516 [Xylariomycetidae sp. FL0641]|nr:hypothetical protein F4780DRAFT_794516 [Xylariomycetidae sp. FL0641]